MLINAFVWVRKKVGERVGSGGECGWRCEWYGRYGRGYGIES